MAINNATKRASMIGFGIEPFLPMIQPRPPGGSVNDIERLVFVGLYGAEFVTAGTEFNPPAPPVNGVYTITKRFINNQWVYYTERMDDRLWEDIEDVWAVDAALALPLYQPNATLTADAMDGSGNITSYNIISGGTGYTSPTGTISDPNSDASGATVSFTLSGGVITAASAVTTGQDYTVGGAKLVVSDGTGSGAVIQPIVTNYVSFATDIAVFQSYMVGMVLRMGGGIANIVTFTDTQHVVADVIETITDAPSDPGDDPIPFAPGLWSIANPVTVVSGLTHLEGMTVTGLADGNVIPPTVVVNGKITLPQPASRVVVGLGFLAQVQSLPLDTGTPTTVGKRKRIYSVTALIENSRGFSIGTNQPDSPAQQNQAVVEWENLVEWKQRGQNVNAGTAIPLYTGFARLNVKGGWKKGGQVALQQAYPLPMNIDAIVPEIEIGDNDG